MTQKYNGEWLYPPRTKVRIPFEDSPILNRWMKYSDAVAQYKMNGTNTLIQVSKSKEITLWSRHKVDGQPQTVKNYSLTPNLRNKIAESTPNGTCIINAELMHFKTKNVKDTLYLFDVLVWDGIHLLGVPYAQRHSIVSENFDAEPFCIDMPSCHDKLSVAANMLPHDWHAAWAKLQQSSYCEGLVLKRTGNISALRHGLSEINNDGYMCRIRKPLKNFLW